MNIIFLGPPGIGKGTQAKIVAQKKQILHLSTGDMLRIAIEKRNEVGLLAELYMNKGRLVPDEIVLDLVSQRLKQEDIQEGFIFDGFPRTLNQANELKSLLKKNNYKIDHVIALNGKNEILINRLTSRRTCSKCQQIINLIFNPPKRNEVCDYCDGKLVQRDDDKLEIITNRLRIYEIQTKPLVDFYSNENLLRKINGIGNLEQITKRIENIL
ncbi:MAG: adenylate kinase [Candidatus Marinimicrobia bacterium]|nr:adenylate kinase [Candidatus Neomarinimicrobiota bacterium]OUW50066.1 MAG: adenylate kinase [bacterium TMED190]|tara:strand:+ start:8709 stop:9347 length:639 start_codon:yes stop_codon:yes gene_type:complete